MLLRLPQSFNAHAVMDCRPETGRMVTAIRMQFIAHLLRTMVVVHTLIGFLQDPTFV